MRSAPLFLLVFSLTAGLILWGCPEPPESPHAEATISETGGTLTLGDAAVRVKDGALPSPVKIQLTQDAAGETVERDENETPVSDVYTLTNDQDVVVDSMAEPFNITLPFDSAGIVKDSAMEAKVYVKMETEDDIFTMVGTIEGDTVTIGLVGLHYDANLQVVYNPNAEFIIEDEPAVSKRLTGESPWQTVKWVLQADATNSVLRSAAAQALGISESTLTIEQVRDLLKEKVGRNAREISEMYSGMQVREPNIATRTREDGQKRFVLILTNKKNAFAPPDNENGIGQLNIGCQILGWGPTYWLGQIRGVIAHELFHACVNGYGLKMGRTTLRRKLFTGYNEGMATVIGHTIDNDNLITVRQVSATHDYSMKLDNPLCLHDPRLAAYANNDFFAYIGKKYGGGSLNYLIGTGTDDDGYLTGVMDQLRKYLSQDQLLLPWASEADSYLIAYRTALHNAMVLEFGESLANVYWDFARNRAYENNEESRLRAEDPATRWQLRTERFESAGIVEKTFSSNQQTIQILGDPALTDIPPLATRAIVLNGIGFNANLTVAFDISTWQTDPLGGGIQVKAYHAGLNGLGLADDGTVQFANFGYLGFEQVVILVSNLAVTAAQSVDLIAETEPFEEPAECSPDQPTDRWRISYDLDCDGSFESEDFWHFETGGAIRDELGIIPGYSWSFEEGEVYVSFGPDAGGMHGTMNVTCTAILDGRFTGDIVRQTCWRAIRY